MLQKYVLAHWLLMPEEPNIKKNCQHISSIRESKFFILVSPSFLEVCSFLVCRNQLVMKVITSHFHYCSCLNMNSLMLSIFPDSHQIVKSFQMSKIKQVYYTIWCSSYGKGLLLQIINSSPAHAIFIDEFFNQQLQDERSDSKLNVLVGFWNNESVQIETCYLDGRYFKWSDANNMEELFHSVICIPKKKYYYFLWMAHIPIGVFQKD